MLNELTSWLPGSRADTFLDPDLPNYFVHDQSQAEPRKYINAIKEEENDVVDVLNEAVSPTTFTSYFNVNKYIISEDLEEGRKVFAALISPNSSAHHELQKFLFWALVLQVLKYFTLKTKSSSLYFRPKFTFGNGKHFGPPWSSGFVPTVLLMQTSVVFLFPSPFHKLA